MYEDALEFMVDNAEHLDRFEELMYDYGMAIRGTKDPDTLLALFGEAEAAFYKMQIYCYAAGPGGKEHFDEMFMHCHNAKNPDFCILDPWRERVKKYCK